MESSETDWPLCQWQYRGTRSYQMVVDLHSVWMLYKYAFCTHTLRVSIISVHDVCVQSRTNGVWLVNSLSVRLLHHRVFDTIFTATLNGHWMAQGFSNYCSIRWPVSIGVQIVQAVQPVCRASVCSVGGCDLKMLGHLIRWFGFLWFPRAGDCMVTRPEDRWLLHCRFGIMWQMFASWLVLKHTTIAWIELLSSHDTALCLHVHFPAAHRCTALQQSVSFEAGSETSSTLVHRHATTTHLYHLEQRLFCIGSMFITASLYNDKCCYIFDMSGIDNRDTMSYANFNSGTPTVAGILMVNLIEHFDVCTSVWPCSHVNTMA